MSYDLFRGRTAKNFAIQGHPPIHSFEYVMAGGGYVRPAYAPPARRWHPRAQSSSGAARVADVEEFKIPDKKGFYLYEISNTDWDAATRWMNNLAENVKYTRQVYKDKILPPEEVARFTDLWRRWLLFGNKINVVKKKLQDESFASKVLSATSPLYWASRRLYYTAQESLALMSADNKRELDSLLGEAWKLYSRFRLLGMSQVAIPYMGELVILLRTLPHEMTLTDMIMRLRDSAKVGERLLDVNTAWWEWRKRDETKPLRQAIAEARDLADELGKVAKTPPGQGVRDSGAPVYIHVVRTMAKIYVEAAGLYGIEETKTSARAEAVDEGKRGGERAVMSIGWLLATAGIGYLGIRWLTRPSTTIIVGNQTPGFHPGEHHSEEETPESEHDHG